MEDPKIAVLIPAYNEEPVIAGTIDALIKAEVLVSDIYIVDDRSTDNTADIARACGVNVYTVPENGGKARAQVAALTHFKLCDRYDWIIFLDGDTKVDSMFFKELKAAAIEQPDSGLFVGQVKSVSNSHIFSASRAFDYTYGHDLVKKAQDNFNCIFVSPGCASMYKSSVLKNLHIDPDTLAEDMDLTMQVHRAKKPVVYVHEAFVNTQDPSTLKDYHKQILRWYRGFWQVIKKHKVFGFAKKQMVDIYMAAILLDAIIFNRIFWLIGLIFINSNNIALLFAIDVLFSFSIAAYSSWRTKRLDVLYKFPIYYWIAFINFYAFIRAFVEIIIMRKTILAWNKVARYSFSV